MTPKERGQKWRAKQLKERPEEFRKYNAERAKVLYNKNPNIAHNQQQNFKRSYDENQEFRAKVILSASLGLYRVTPAEFAAKLLEQGGHCALCSSTDGDAGRRLHVDHNHKCCDHKRRTCGKCNRGLLCGPCNRRLAAVEDLLTMATSVVPKWDTWLENALLYLTKYGCR